MELTKEELDALRMLLKTEIFETKALINKVSGKDKIELKDYLSVIEGINKKL